MKTLPLKTFSHPLLAVSAIACAAINVAGAADSPLRAKSAESSFQPSAFDIQPEFAGDWVPNLFDVANFGRQFRIGYADTQEIGSNVFSAAASSVNFEPASIESDKERIGGSHSLNFQGLFAAAQLRYDIDSVSLTDDLEGGGDPDSNSFDSWEIELAAMYGIKHSGSVWGNISPLSPGEYTKSSVSGMDRAWSHRVAHPQLSLKF